MMICPADIDSDIVAAADVPQDVRGGNFTYVGDVSEMFKITTSRFCRNFNMFKITKLICCRTFSMTAVTIWGGMCRERRRE